MRLPLKTGLALLPLLSLVAVASATPPQRPEAVFVSDRQVTRVTFVAKGRIAPASTFDLMPYSSRAHSRGPWRAEQVSKAALLVHTDTALVQLRLPGLSFERAFRAAPETRLAAFARLDHEHLLVSAEGKLIVLSKKWRRLAELPLVVDDERGTTKNAHDMLVHESIAYLLDDMRRPSFVFRVDVSVPASPRVLQRFDMSDVNARLTAQWVDPAKGNWAIVQSQGIQTGDRQFVQLLELGKGTKIRAKTQLYDSTPQRQVQPAHPRWIHGVVAPNASVALTLDQSTQPPGLWLSRLGTSEAGVQLEQQHRIGEGNAGARPWAGGITGKGDWLLLWTLPRWGKADVRLVRQPTSGKPEVGGPMEWLGPLYGAALLD